MAIPFISLIKCHYTFKYILKVYVIDGTTIDKFVVACGSCNNSISISRQVSVCIFNQMTVFFGRIYLAKNSIMYTMMACFA